MTFGPHTHFHTGFVVRDIAAAMDALRSTFQVRWMQPDEARLEVWIANKKKIVPIRYVYSIDEGHYIELIEAVPGTVYELESERAVEFHHCGYVSDAFVSDVEFLESEGLILEMAGAAGDVPTPSRFAYVRHELGPRVELVTTEVGDLMEARIASLREQFGG